VLTVGATETPARREVVLWLALAFAMVFPTAAAWSYFLALAAGGGAVNPQQQFAYVLGKAVQFAFPVLLVALGVVARPRLAGPRRDGMALGLGFGLLVAAVMLGVYFGALRHSSVLAETPARLREKLEQVGMATPGRYVVLAGFIVLAHSLLEEYYWRWFVFGQLRRLLPLAPAAVLSSLAFMAHHVVVLYVYLPGRFLTAVLPFSLGIAAGGVVWAWLYERSGTLYPSWASHLVVDAAIFVLGWDLLWGSGAG
jgi:membrane protease YdiL (CAAX protease family)